MKKEWATIKAVKIKETLVPFWELKYRDDDDYGDTYYSKEGEGYDLMNVYYNINTKEISLGKKVELTKNKYKVGDKLYVKVDIVSQKLELLELEKIEFYEIDRKICFGKDMEEYYVRHLSEQIEPDTIYHVVEKVSIYYFKGKQKRYSEYDIFELI